MRHINYTTNTTISPFPSISVFSPHMFTSTSKYVSQSNSEKGKRNRWSWSKSNDEEMSFMAFLHPSTIFMAYLDVYCPCMTITFLLSLVGPFAVPFRGISLRAHPSSDPACYAAGCPRRASIAWSVLATCISRVPPPSLTAMISVPDPLLSVLFTAHYPLLPGRIQNAVPRHSWVGFTKLNGTKLTN